MNKNFKQKNEWCITQTATDLSNMKVKNELQLILARKIWTYVSGEICNLRETLLVVSHHIYCSAPILPAHKSVWTIKCLVFQTDHWESWMVLIVLDALQLLNDDMLFLISLFHCLTLHMFHWGMALSSASAQDGSPVQSPVMRGMWSHWSQCFDLVMFNLYSV